ncbi:MAG: hypothetical protein IPN86_15045 [Saprospiraceae bacterium]|jgi:hypothetical protein|nr:hypothetical protein [Saprospiraceae bacterium]
MLSYRFLYIQSILIVFFTGYISAQSGINTRVFNFGVHRNPTELLLPKACELISLDEIQSALGVKDIQVKSTGNPGDVKVSNCFFKWEDPAMPYTGMLLQVMTNPLYDDNPEYISYLIESKLTEGESEQGSTKNLLFKEAMVGKVKVVYAIENGRVYWNIGDNYLFMLTFNIAGLKTEKMLTIAQKLIPVINKNLLGKLLE